MPATKTPKNLKDIIKDKKLLKEFSAFCKKEHCDEALTFVQIKTWKSENLYRMYFKDGAKKELNLPGKVKKEIEELAEKELWSDKRWKKLVKAATVNATKLLEKSGGQVSRFIRNL